MQYDDNNCYISRLKEAIRIFYDNLNWFFSRFYLEFYLVWNFLTVMGEGMTGTLGSRVTGARNVAIRSHSRLPFVAI